MKVPKMQIVDDDNSTLSGGVNNITSSNRKSLKNPQVNSNTKRVASLSKKIENVEYLIKIEQKNKKQLEDKYSKTIEKLENQVEKYEKDLENTLRELNEKESKIFDIQKNKLETFRHEIQKYENVYYEIEEKYKNVNNVIENAHYDEKVLYNHSGLIFEDYLSYNHEIILLKKRILDLKETMADIEKTYPKEFQFLLEDIQLEKELNEITVHKKQYQEDIDKLERNRKDLNKVKELKSYEVQNLLDEIKKIEVSIESTKKDNHLLKLEDYIIKNINDLLIFEKLKILIQNYYNQKNFDMENELNVLLIKNLNEKLKEMKNEFVSIKNEKMLAKSKLEKSIEDLFKISNSNKDKSKIEKEIKTRQSELDRLNNEINILELNCKKKETLFNKYIIVLRNKCKKSAQESYYEMNPSLIIETEFEEKFKEEIIKNIEKDNKFTEEEKLKNKNLVEIYFKELVNREKILQSCVMKKKKAEENVESLTKEIEKIEENLQLCETEISTKKSMISEITVKEKIYFEKIEARNRNLTCNLEQMGELEFEKYLKSNDQILKNMKKIYGNKVLDKVFKVQKQKFLENIIMDHSFKKGKVNEYIHVITKFETVLDSHNSNISELENNYKIMKRKYESLINERETKQKEKGVLEESKNDLREKMEMILQSQLKEIEVEKKQLQFKFNVNYYIEKVKDLSDRINEAKEEKERLIKEYENFSKVIHEKEQKLYIEDLDLKNNLISLNMGVSDEHNPMTMMPYKVNMNKSYDSVGKGGQLTAKVDYDSASDDLEEKQNKFMSNFEDMMKSSIAEYNNKDFKEDLLDDALKSDDEMKKTANSYKSQYHQDPFLSFTIEKIKPLVTGLSLYKKFNNNSMNGKIFDPLNSKDATPENCGYALRTFIINTSFEMLEIKNAKKQIEQKINLSQVKGILLNSAAKNILKQKKNASIKPNQEISKLIACDYIPFILLHSEGKLDLIAPTYQVFKCIEAAVEEIIKNKKNLFGILKYMES